MREHRRSARLLAFAAAMAFGTALLGCGRPPPPTPSPAPTMTPTPDPAAILREAGGAMADLKTVRWTMTRAGGPAYLDATGTLNLTSASGDYAAPDAMRGTIRVQGPGINLELQTIAIGPEQWVTNPLSGRWEKLPPGWGFNPAILFDKAFGLEPLLREDVVSARIVDVGGEDGVSVAQIEAEVAGERVAALTAGLAQDASIAATIWIDLATRRITMLQFSSASPTGEPSDWTITFAAFDAPLTIRPPET